MGMRRLVHPDEQQWYGNRRGMTETLNAV